MHILNEMKDFIKKKSFEIGKQYLNKKIKNRTFTIISNDCWGGEIYKLLDLPFNTPFVGCMLMAPCYLKLLSNLKSNLNLPLQFVSASSYSEVNQLLKEKGYFPIGKIGNEIEIQFLHFKNEQEVREKWARRLKRIQWDQIFVKFDGGKDYATPALIKDFEKLDIKNKLLILPNYPYKKQNAEVPPYLISLQNYSKNGAIQFYKSLKEFSLPKWLNGNAEFGPESFTNLIIKICFGNIIKLQ